MQDNVNFAFHIDGFYCNASIAGNRFQGNKCRTGCVTLSGTEKEAEIVDNEFIENSGRYIVELHMNSHTPYTQVCGEERRRFHIDNYVLEVYCVGALFHRSQVMIFSANVHLYVLSASIIHGC